MLIRPRTPRRAHSLTAVRCSLSKLPTRARRRYNGVANGLYSAGGMVEYFDADASLTANFGGGAESTADGATLAAVTGSITNIRAAGMDVAGSLTLGRTTITEATATPAHPQASAMTFREPWRAGPWPARGAASSTAAVTTPRPLQAPSPRKRRDIPMIRSESSALSARGRRSKQQRMTPQAPGASPGPGDGRRIRSARASARASNT